MRGYFLSTTALREPSIIRHRLRKIMPSPLEGIQPIVFFENLKSRNLKMGVLSTWIFLMLSFVCEVIGLGK